MSFLRRSRAGACARSRALLAAAGFCICLSAGLNANLNVFAAEKLAASLADLTLEQLGEIEITSVSRHPQRLIEAAASVYVISADDIRRSGAKSLAEALRLAPNLQVARADTNQWAISGRGMNSVLANKMLVLIDGRTVYSPLFSGVFWEAQDMMLEDIERIEVISGSAGSQWGTNAVNGVISVITRSAGQTQGVLFGPGAGNREQSGAARYGGEFANGGNYRVYGRAFNRLHSSTANGTSVGDASGGAQAGFRADWAGGAGNATVQGDFYANDVDQGLSTRRVSGGNILGRWSRDLGGGASWQVQSYLDHSERHQPGSVNDILDTFDVDFQHGFKPWANHFLLWGAGFRYSADRTDNINPAALAIYPAHLNQRWANVFVQDEIALMPTLKLTAGVRLERNDYTGLEVLPDLRLAWRAAPDHLVWGSASRAVRAPSRVDRDFFSPGRPPFFIIAGGPNFQSETANVYELGYRAQFTQALAYSITAFHHDFDRLRSVVPTSIGPQFANGIDGTTDGVEMWGSYRVRNWWRVDAGFVQQRERLRVKTGAVDLGGINTLGNDPRHWWTLRSSWDLGPRYEFDVMVRNIGALPNPAVPGYTAVDMRFGFRASRELELSVSAQNLFDPRHAEWGVAPGRPEFERGVFFKALWRQ